MCEKCDEQIARAKAEAIALLNGEHIEATLDDDPEGWTEAARMSLVIARVAVIISKCEPETNRLNGAPLSIILGSLAGVAMEAEMISASMNDLLSMFGGGSENLN